MSANTPKKAWPGDEYGKQAAGNPAAHHHVQLPVRPTVITSFPQGLHAPSSAVGAAAGNSSASASHGTPMSGYLTSASTPPTTASSSNAPSLGTTPSSGMAPSPSWQTNVNGRVNGMQQLAGPVQAHLAANYLPGLGLQFGNMPPYESTADQVTMPERNAMQGPVWPTHGSRTYHYTQASIVEPRVHIQNGVSTGVPAPKTHPLPPKPVGGQQGICDQPHISPVKHVEAAPDNLPRQAEPANTTQVRDFAKFVNLRGSDNDSIITNPYAEDNGSTISAISAHFTQDRPHLIGQDPSMFEELANKGSWRMQVRDHGHSIRDAAPGGAGFLNALNPANFQMKWGDRVVCIKTNFVANIHVSVKSCIWAESEKVGLRINRIWEARQKDTGDDAILIFSINNQKSFCGLGKMRGPWKKGPVPAGWQSTADGTRAEGTFPVQWVFVKNVAYDHFKDVKHPTIEQPIVNMWDGMHYPYEEGRKVVEIYVENAHFTNVLAYRSDRPYHPFKYVSRTGLIDPRLNSNNRPRFTKGASPLPSNLHNGGDETPRGNEGCRTVSVRVDTTPFTPAHATFDGHASPTPLPGQVVQCIMDSRGNYVPLAPSSPAPMLQGMHGPFLPNHGHSAGSPVHGHGQSFAPPVGHPPAFQPSQTHFAGSPVHGHGQSFASPVGHSPAFQMPGHGGFSGAQFHGHNQSFASPGGNAPGFHMPGHGGFNGAPVRQPFIPPVGNAPGFHTPARNGFGHLMMGGQSFNNAGHAYPPSPSILVTPPTVQRVQAPAGSQYSPINLRGMQSMANMNTGYHASPIATPPTVQRVRAPINMQHQSPTNLRGMQSMYNMNTGYTAPPITDANIQALHYAASKPNVFAPRTPSEELRADQNVSKFTIPPKQSTKGSDVDDDTPERVEKQKTLDEMQRMMTEINSKLTMMNYKMGQKKGKQAEVLEDSPHGEDVKSLSSWFAGQEGFEGKTPSPPSTARSGTSIAPANEQDDDAESVCSVETHGGVSLE